MAHSTNVPPSTSRERRIAPATTSSSARPQARSAAASQAPPCGIRTRHTGRSEKHKASAAITPNAAITPKWRKHSAPLVAKDAKPAAIVAEAMKHALPMSRAAASIAASRLAREAPPATPSSEAWRATRWTALQMPTTTMKGASACVTAVRGQPSQPIRPSDQTTAMPIAASDASATRKLRNSSHSSAPIDATISGTRRRESASRSPPATTNSTGSPTSANVKPRASHGARFACRARSTAVLAALSDDSSSITSAPTSASAEIRLPTQSGSSFARSARRSRSAAGRPASTSLRTAKPSAVGTHSGLVAGPLTARTPGVACIATATA